MRQCAEHPDIETLFLCMNCLFLPKYFLHFKEQILLSNYTSDFSGNFHHQPAGVVFHHHIGRFHQAGGPFDGQRCR